MLHIARRCKRLAMFFLLLLPVPAIARSRAALPSTVDTYARQHEFSGTILVRQAGRTLYARSFGLADRAFGIPATAATRYRIASITKLFTSVLILQLAQEGRLDLDAPFGRVLPDYPGQGADRVTVHQLLNHTSGIPQWVRINSPEEAFANGVAALQTPLDAVALLRRCCSGPLEHAPGTLFSYNNADYLLLGRIVERLTGQSFEAALEARILRPLGLASTGMMHWDRIVPRLAPTYFWREDQHRLAADMPVYWENWGASGGLWSTADDLARFADALYGGRLLRPAMMARLLRPGLDDYGYGLWSYSVTRQGRAHRVAKRPGSIMGANSVLYRLLDEGVTILLLANTNRVDLDVFAQRIADRIVAQ